MNRAIVTFTFFLFGISCYAQTEIKGKVLDNKKRNPIVAATVILHPVGLQDILTYGTTGEDGSFVLKKAGLPDTVVISVRSMNTEPFSKIIKSNIDFVELNVTEKAIALNEVIVKPVKIRQKGDTLNYSVSSFVDVTDKSIGDVLKKLPGIQVLSSGKILYQNKAISKFYIEGLDMLRGKYGIATNNIDASKVATVQVLENHQPIKVLKDMEIPEEAAINLKLKESAKGAFFATVQPGLGLPLWLFNNELVGMRFTRKQQNMLVFKDDNTGRDIAQELVSFYDNTRNVGVNFLSVSKPGTPLINKQHFLFNNANVVSMNNLYVINKDMTLTGNLNFLHDKQTQNGFSERQIFLTNGQKVTIVEDAQNQLLKRELEGNLVWESNLENKYLSNKLRAIGKWNNENSMLLPSSSSQNNQSLQSSQINISNDFEYMFKRHRQQYRIGAYAGYVSQPVSLSSSPSSLAEIVMNNPLVDSVMLQDVRYRQFSSNAYFSGGFGEKFIISYKAQIFTNIYRLHTQMYNDLNRNIPLIADSLQNDLSRNEFGGILSTSISYKFSSSLYGTITIPFEYVWMQRKDLNHNLNKNKGYTLFSPFLQLNYIISPRIKLFIIANHNQSIGGIQEDYSGYIMGNYRSVKRTGLIQSENRSTFGSISMDYKNPFTAFFGGLYFSFSNNWTNILRDYRYNGIYANEDGIYHPNSSNTVRGNLSLGKNVDAICSDLKLHVGFLYFNGLTLNQGEITKFSTQSWNISPSVSSEITKWLIIKYNADYRQSLQVISEEKKPMIHNFRQNITTSIIPIKILILSLSFNHYYNSALSVNTKSAWFGNIGLKYIMKKVEIMIDWTNIFNTRQFITSSYSNVMSYYAQYVMRPTEVLLRVKFKLL